MTMPFTLPDWAPWWVPIALLVPIGLYALALLFMPFAVLGVKSRLEGIELRLDEIQGEIRSLALRLQEPVAGTADFDDSYISPPTPPSARLGRGEPFGHRPPIPPAAHPPAEPLAAVDRRLASMRRNEERRPPSGQPPEHTGDAGRAEPRLNWPRATPPPHEGP